MELLLVYLSLSVLALLILHRAYLLLGLTSSSLTRRHLLSVPSDLLAIENEPPLALPSPSEETNDTVACAPECEGAKCPPVGAPSSGRTSFSGGTRRWMHGSTGDLDQDSVPPSPGPGSQLATLFDFAATLIRNDIAALPGAAYGSYVFSSFSDIS